MEIDLECEICKIDFENGKNYAYVNSNDKTAYYRVYRNKKRNKIREYNAKYQQSEKGKKAVQKAYIKHIQSKKSNNKLYEQG